MRILLKLQHWQVVGLFIIAGYLSNINSRTAIIKHEHSIVSVTNSPFSFVLMFLYFAWPWTVAENLYKKLLSGIKFNIVKFRVFILIPIIIFLVDNIFDWFVPVKTQANYFNTQIGLIVGIVSVFLMVIWFLYCINFIAKELLSVELNRRVLWQDYSNTFFMLFFMPFGIWIIQPRINKIFTRQYS